MAKHYPLRIIDCVRCNKVVLVYLTYVFFVVSIILKIQNVFKQLSHLNKIYRNHSDICGSVIVLRVDVVDEIVRSWFLICAVSSSECYLEMQDDLPMIIEEPESTY